MRRANYLCVFAQCWLRNVTGQAPEVMAGVADGKFRTPPEREAEGDRSAPRRASDCEPGSGER
jgi:hypothetical protein